MASCICAARRGAANPSKRCAALGSYSPGRAAHAKNTPSRGFVNVSLAAESAEDREPAVPRARVPRCRYALAAGLDVAVETLRERVGVLAGGRADDEVLEPPLRLVALGL